MAVFGAYGFRFSSARLRFRPLDAVDERLFCELYTDAETMRFVGQPLSRERAAGSFRKALTRNSQTPIVCCYLAVVEKCDGRPIGICSIHKIDRAQRRAEAGIILQPAARGRGRSKEAFAALITTSFAVLPVDEIRAEISVDHLAAECMVAGIGFIESDLRPAEGRLPARRVWSAHRGSWCEKTNIK
jgi:RimJ/RimL family protein N-acetyltransferase